MLVALAVLGLLLAMLTQATRFGLTAWQAQSTGIDRQSDLAAVDAALRRLVARAVPGRSRSGRPGVHRHGGRVPLHHHAARRRLRSADAARRGLAARGRIAPAGAARVPSPHAQWLGTPPEPKEDVLLDHVDGIRLAYWRVAENGAGAWDTSWSDTSPPRLVRLHIDFSHKDGRSWPDMVMATIAEAPPQ